MKSKAESLFRTPAPLTAMDRTTSEARAIIEEEARQRHELVTSLKAARLAKQAEMTAPTEPIKKRKK